MLKIERFSFFLLLQEHVVSFVKEILSAHLLNTGIIVYKFFFTIVTLFFQQ
jgi:hypothetical protein